MLLLGPLLGTSKNITNETLTGVSRHDCKDEEFGEEDDRISPKQCSSAEEEAKEWQKRREKSRQRGQVTEQKVFTMGMENDYVRVDLPIESIPQAILLLWVGRERPQRSYCGGNVNPRITVNVNRKRSAARESVLQPPEDKNVLDAAPR